MGGGEESTTDNINTESSPNQIMVRLHFELYKQSIPRLTEPKREVNGIRQLLLRATTLKSESGQRSSFG